MERPFVSLSLQASLVKAQQSLVSEFEALVLIFFLKV